MSDGIFGNMLGYLSIQDDDFDNIVSAVILSRAPLKTISIITFL